MSLLDRLRPHTDLTVLKAPSAPGLWLAFGTWRGGTQWPRPIIPYSAGKGVTQHRAERACLGEMAEHLSVGVWAHDPSALVIARQGGTPFEVDPRNVLVHDLDHPDDPGSDGIAAGETLKGAIEAALGERLERIARRRWWAGEEDARPVLEDWLVRSRLRAYEASLRGPMAERWRTSFYLIGEGLPLPTVIAITSGPEGRSLGTAADPDPLEAARRALNEAILEEVPLLTAAGKTLADMSDEERMGVERSTALRVHAESTAAPRVRAFRCFQWLKTNVKCFSTRHRRVGVVSPSDGTTPEHGLDDLSEHSELDFQCVDLTNATVGIPVVRAMIAEPV